MKTDQLNELLLLSLEHEKGGVKIYEAALKCAINDGLKKEWSEYLVQTRHHVDVLTNVCSEMGIDTDQSSPIRTIVYKVGASLVAAMYEAITAGNPEAAQLLAAECVVLAETKDHMDWELIAKCAEHMSGAKAQILKKAADEVEDQEDEHLYHSKGWARELWFEALGMKAILPPPEERKNVKTAIDAARAEKASEEGR